MSVSATSIHEERGDSRSGQPPLGPRDVAGLLQALDCHAIAAITDHRGRIIHANPLFCEVSGYTLDELLGQDHRILNSGKHPRRFMRDLWRTIAKGEIWHGEFCNRKKDGELYWVKSTIVPVIGVERRPEAYISIRTDVTALRRIEQQLASSEARFRRLFEQSADALLLLDIDRGVFLDANDAAARMLGYNRGQDVAGLSPAMLSPASQENGYDSATEAQRMIGISLEAGSHRFEWLHCSDRRAPFPVEVLLTPIDLDDQRLLFVTWRDISARHLQRRWTEASSRTLDGIARRFDLADVLTPLFDFATEQLPGLGLALLQRTRPGTSPEVVLSRNLSAESVEALATAGPEVSLCPWLGDDECSDRCAGAEACGSLSRLAATGRLRVVPLEDVATRRSSLIKVLPDAPLGADPVLGETPWALWLDLIRLAVDDAGSREQLALSQTVFDNSADGIAICDATGRILHANPALARMIGSGDIGDALVGQHLGACFDTGSSSMPEMLNELSVSGTWLGECRGRRQDGELRTWLVSATLVAGNPRGERVIILADVSAQRAQRERIEHLAFYDSLTRLPNRSLLQEQLEHASVSVDGEPSGLCLLYLDLDRFKEVNDSCGHAVGDRVLTVVAGRLRTALPAEHLLARMGGDEFMVLAQLTGEPDAIALAEQLLGALNPPISIEGRNFVLGASIGISLLPSDAQSADELMQHADIAMFQAKRSGGGWCVYHRELGSTLNRRLLLAERLAQALRNRSLLLHYQPQIDLGNGLLHGAEVLLRWHEPELGWVPPSEFIPIAEDSGQMPALGEFVLESACAQLAEWRQRGFACALKLSINLSPLQITAPNFEGRLQRILDHSGLPTDALELELTESTLVADPEAAIQLFRGLAARGLTLAIDDFGTGYSSLSYLKRFPVSRLKIDQSFVRDMLSSANDAAIVETIIAMARALSLATVAEGVESQAQATRLTELGCTTAQGFLFAPGLAAEAFETHWLVPQERATISGER